jgi:hypothetical protein
LLISVVNSVTLGERTPVSLAKRGFQNDVDTKGHIAPGSKEAGEYGGKETSLKEKCCEEANCEELERSGR